MEGSDEFTSIRKFLEIFDSFEDSHQLHLSKYKRDLKSYAVFMQVSKNN